MHLNTVGEHRRKNVNDIILCGLFWSETTELIP